MPLKRANGTGSVYKMKHKKLRKPYRAMVTLGWTDEGKPIRKTIGTFEKAKDARDALSSYAVSPETFETKKITFRQAWEWMLADKERQGVDMKQAKYGAIADKIPYLMNIPIADIKVAHLQAIIDDNSHLSYSTLQHIKAGLNGAFKAAIKNDVITKNYASMVILPPSKKSTIHTPFTYEEIYTLWQHTDILLVRILLIYIYTGLRPIELRKIERKNVFLKEHYMIGGVKTAAGRNRIIPIANCIAPFIAELYAVSQFKQSPLLVPKGHIQVRLDPPMDSLLPTLGIAPHKPHDCRHTFITLASNVGITEHILKTIVGHAQSDVTNDVYIHKTKQQLIDAVNLLPYQEKLITGCATVVQRI